ncbi:MAG: S-layer homology domain-containing protein, partial [Peptoniphilus sp.]|nr:S-layer homology domain-containing protein [Peptoniphilus sp.]
GDEIKLSGTIGAYNGLTQLQNPKNIGRISQNKALPEPQEITIETLLSKGEEYESERVLIREAIIGTYSPNEFNTMLTQNGKTVAMFKIPGLSEGIVENDKVNVTAVASQHHGYQLRVAKIEDIVKVAGGDPVAPTTYTSDIFTEEFLKEHDAMLIPEVLKLPNETPSTVVGVAVYSYSGGSALIIQDYVNGEIVGYQIYGPTENVQPGDIVVVSGNRVKFYDTDETSNITAMQMIDPQALNMTDEQRAKYDLVCQPQLVTKDMIAQNQTKYYNEYLRINDLTLPEHDGGSGQVDFKYADESTLQSYRIPEYPIGTKAGDVVDILCAGAVHSGRFQVRLDTYKDYIIKNDALAPFVVVPEFLDAKAGQDYIFQVDIMDNVEVTGAKAILVNADNLEIPLQRDEITGAYKGTIAKENFKDLTELELKFEATDGKQISSGYYKKPFIYGTSENITENIKIPVDSRPFVKETAPKTNEEVLDTLKPQITATILNPVEGMKVTLTLNGVAHDMTFADGKAVFTPAADLQEGKITAQISITDARGEKIADDYDWSFYIGKAQYRHYYGQIHSHTDYSDGAGSLKDALDHASNADQIDFFSITDHSNKFDAAGNLGTFDNEDSGLRSTIDSTRSKWEEYKETIANYTADDFLPFYGFEMTWTSSGANYGHINTFNTMGFFSRNDPEFNNKESSAGIIKYYEALTTLENSFSQFNHPGKTFGNFDEFGHYDARYDAELQLVEVGNGEGPIHGSGYYPSYEQYTKALDKGWHVAPSNNQDNHKGKWGDANDGRNVAIADSLTLTAIMDAVDNHRWYSTEDKNLKINYTLNGNIMGSKLEIPSEEKMRIEVEVIDPDAEDIVGKVEVISNGGKVLGTENINSNSGTANFTVRNSGTYYYIRITQVDKDIAVTAPVWTKKVVAADIDSVVKNTQSEEVGQPVTLTTVFNNPTEKDITISKIEYVVKESGEALATVDTNLPTLTKNQKTNIEQVIIPTTVGLQTVEVKIYTDSSTPYTKGIKLNVYPEYMKVTSIADVQRAEEEKQFMIEGVLTSNAGGFDANTAFFDSAYVQDATGGINIFPINNDFSEGTKVRIKGTTDSYEGEHQLNISTIEKIEGPIEKVEPKELKTGEVKDNLGLLVKVEGEVKEVNKENGVIADLVLDDGSGSIRVFINGYIGKLNSADKTMPEFKIGDRAEATGLSSIDPEGNRIRVRNRDDVKLMEDVQDDPNTPSEPNKPNEPNKPDKPTKPGNIYPTINDVWKDDEEVFEPHYYYTGSLVSWKTTDKAEDEVTDYWNKVEDIKGHWAEDIIKEVLKRGLMDLKGGKFMPDAPTTRVDVVKAIAKLEKVDPKQYMGKSLSDIDSESLESGYINWAVEKGIINGYEDETFKPEREITREEIAKILNRYVENLNKNFPTKESIDFKDFEDIADWAKKDVNKAVERGLLRGRDTGEFDPRGDLTRAEVAQILFNIFSK